MYLPALTGGSGIEVTAVAGRDRGRAEAFAARWDIAGVFTDVDEMIASDLFEAVVIATPNDTHHPFATRALRHGLHVLCEKPLALSLAQAEEMAALAVETGAITLVPFTYRYMPATRYLKRLIEEGYLGRPYHAHFRYYAGYGRDGAYSWRFDQRRAGTGALGDLGSHFLHLAEWFLGEAAAVSCQLATLVGRPELDPEGRRYQQLDDTAMMMLRFESGALGMVHATTLAYEDTPFGQVHELDFHGSDGTLRLLIDWASRQELWGARVGEGPSRRLDIPDAFWGGARREVVTDTYKDMFRHEGFMIREFVEAVRRDRPIRPDFNDGLRVQRVLEAASQSARGGCWVEI